MCCAKWASLDWWMVQPRKCDETSSTVHHHGTLVLLAPVLVSCIIRPRKSCCTRVRTFWLDKIKLSLPYSDATPDPSNWEICDGIRGDS